MLGFEFTRAKQTWKEALLNIPLYLLEILDRLTVLFTFGFIGNNLADRYCMLIYPFDFEGDEDIWPY